MIVFDCSTLVSSVLDVMKPFYFLKERAQAKRLFF